MTEILTSFSRLSSWLPTVLLITTGLTGSLAAQAQQAPGAIQLAPEDKGERLYGRQHNFYFLPPGRADEEDNYQNAGFFGQKLRPYVSSSPEALKELGHYRRQKTLYLADRIVLAGAVITYSTQVLAQRNAQFFSDAQKVSGGAAIASVLATLFINRNTGNYLRQAVDNYNASLSPKPHGAWWPRLQPTSVGIAATPQGQPLLALSWQL